MHMPLQSSKKVDLSIVIPVRNEAGFIGRTLTQIKEQNFPKDCYEILVIDGQSKDNTEAIVKEFIARNPDMRITLLQNHKRLSSAARNIAVKNSNGRFILIIDGHVYLPCPDLLKNYMKAASEHHALVIGRPQPLDPPDISYFQYVVAIARSSFLAHSKESFIYSDFEGFTSPISIGVMYHRSVFSEIGYFDESFDAAEDVEFNYRLEKANYRCFTSPDLTVKYYPRDNFSSLFRQLNRYGLGRSQFICKHPERFTLETLFPVFLVMAIASTPFALFTASYIKYIWLTSILCYIFALCFESLRLLRRHHICTVLLVPLIIVTIHAGLGWGLIKGCATLTKKKLISKLLENSCMAQDHKNPGK